MRKKKWMGLLTLTVLIFCFQSIADENKKDLKYVFYFIGDGLGASQRQITEYYKQQKIDKKDYKLIMNSLPVAGINTSFSTDSLVTDSAAAGTALATGHKTNNDMISVLPCGTKVKTLIQAANEKDWLTGIISTTRLTHATPASFAAHNVNRDNENEIAEDFIASNVDFFAGGGYRHFVKKDSSMNSKREDDRDLVNEFKKLGYKTFIGEDSAKAFKAFTPKAGSKVFAAFTNSHMPYELDRKNQKMEIPALSELVEKNLEVFEKSDKPFFMMVEGGRIDHACHINDAHAAIKDTLAFDRAIRVAYDFYKKHPKETLIVVAADHETGGFGLGFAKNYFIDLDPIFKTKISTEDVYNNDIIKNKEKFYEYIEEHFGLTDLTSSEKEMLENAIMLQNINTYDEIRFGEYKPTQVVIGRIIAARANIFWTTFAHTGTQLPLSAAGVGAEKFGGFIDNTDIAKTIAEVAGLELTTSTT
jgi:alkaline phosphatase